MTIEIRKPQQEDKDAFVRLAVELTKFNEQQHARFYDIKNVLKVRKERVSKMFDKRDEKNYRVLFMAFLDNQPVGYARAYVFDGKLGIGCFDELFVERDIRGQGIGKKLLDAVTDWMKQKGLVRMMLSAYLWNHEAIRFYEEEGFQAYAASYELILNDQPTPHAKEEQ